MKDLILAHDLGTTGNKASLFDSAGRLVASAFAPYDTVYPQPGWAEQDAQDWWRAVVSSTRQMLSTCQRQAGDIAVVSFSGQMMGCLPLDEKGRPLRRALIWADQRATEEAALLRERLGTERVYHITGHRASASYTAAKLLWIKRQQPDIAADMARCVLAKDYVAYRLSGVYATDYSDASGTNLFDLRARQWSPEIFQALELDLELLPPPVPSATVIGGVTHRAAEQTGLLAGTPVVIGGGDGACATTGAGVVNPGDAYNYIGSSSWISFVSRQPLYDPQQRTFTFAHLDPEYVFPTGAMQCAGGSFDWLERLLRGDGEERIYGELDALASAAPPGANGLFFLPYLIGERSPHWNPKARGAFVGLTMSHGRAELSRAVLEGVMFNLRIILEAFCDQGASFEALRLIGGGARAALWRQIAADVLGVPLLLPKLLVEATALGAAIAGGVGVGLFADYSVAGRLVGIVDGEQPSSQQMARYGELFDIFVGLYDALASAYERIAAL